MPRLRSSFFSLPSAGGVGYAGVTRQYGIIAALIAMEMARKAEREKLMDTVTAEGIGTLNDHATEMAVQSNITPS